MQVLPVPNQILESLGKPPELLAAEQIVPIPDILRTGNCIVYDMSYDDRERRTKAAEDEKKSPARWKLTEEDKAFLRSCGIRPN